ncbi:hypothetical protein PUN28_013645 [Cardiocondyla obscurior]|uniref:Uncharacterized protein n=1 Tax=Cardiocondyla obscurior TaxID=286306 RepID=A0AAW2F2C3_9HYME
MFDERLRYRRDYRQYFSRLLIRLLRTMISFREIKVSMILFCS